MDHLAQRHDEVSKVFRVKSCCSTQHWPYLRPAERRGGPEGDVDGEVPDDPLIDGARTPPRALAEPVAEPGRDGPVGAGDEAVVAVEVVEAGGEVAGRDLPRHREQEDRRAFRETHLDGLVVERQVSSPFFFQAFERGGFLLVVALAGIVIGSELGPRARRTLLRTF